MPHRAVPDLNRARSRSLRSNITEAEKRIWFRLRAHRLNGASFRRQVPIGPYVADFVCFDARLIIELDGGQHAENPRDKIRDAWLRSQGFTVLRFWNNHVFGNIEGVMETINRALARSSPPCPALPRKGGGSAPAQGAK